MADGIRAGALYWDLDVKNAEQAKAKVREIGKELDRAMSTGRRANTGLDKVGADADKAGSRVDRLAQQFVKLQGQFRAGSITTSQYTTRLNQLEQGVTRTTRQAGLSATEWGKLGNTMRQVQTAQATFGGSTAQMNARVQSLVNETRTLRNEWQRTGAATTETKARLNALQAEMAELSGELRKADGGWTRFNRQIAQLGVAGRSAEATIAGIEGRVSRLGLASQVQLGVQQQLIGSLYRFGPVGAIAGQSLGLVGGGMGLLSVGATAATGGVIALGAATVALTRAGIPEVKAMQAALNVLKASGEDLTALELDRTIREIQEAATSAGTQFRRSEIATALAEIVKAGVDATDALDLLAPGMRLATVTGQSLNETTTLLLGNIRQFGLETSEAARVADALGKADLNAAESARELSEGLAIVGPIAHAAGFAFEDVLGILVELSNKGMSAADVGATALRGALSALLDPTQKARDTLAGLGVELVDQEGKARPLIDVYFDLVKAFDGNAEAAQAAAEIFDTRAITSILNTTEAARDQADALREATGTLEDYADQVTRDDLQRAQDSLRNAWADLANTFSGTFAEDIVFVTSTLANFLREVDVFMTRHSETPWWAKGTTWQSLNQIAGVLGVRGGAGIFGEDPNAPAGPYTGPPLTFNGRTSRDGLGGNSDSGNEDAIQSMTSLIATARVLKAELDAATSPEGWLKANQAVEQFRGSSERAAEAWRAVVATMSGNTTAGGGVKPPTRTVELLFKDLELAGKDAQREALAFGNTLEAQLDSAKSRANLVNRAITELLEDFDLDPADDRIQYLVGRLEALQALQDRINLRLKTTPASSIFEATTAPSGLAVDQPIAGLLPSPGVKTDARQAELEQLLADTDKLLEGEEARQAARLKNRQALIQSIVATEDLRRATHALGIDVTEALQAGTLEGLEDLEAEIVKRLQDLGDDPSAAPLAGLLTRIREAIRQAEADAREAARAGALAESRQGLALARQAQGEFRLEARALGREVGEAIEEGNLEALRELDSKIVAVLNEVGDDPSAAPLIGFLTRTRSEIQVLEADARSAALALGQLRVSTGSAQAAGERAVQFRDFGRRISTAIGEGSLEALEDVEAELVARLREMGDDPSAAPLAGLLTRTRGAIDELKPLIQAATGADVELIEAQIALGEATEKDLVPALEAQIAALEALMPNVAVGSEEWFAYAEALAEAREQLNSMGGASVAKLQKELIALRNAGVEPTSEAVQELVRQINELQLRMALQELKDKGAGNLSEFAKGVLIANGVMVKTAETGATLLDRLKALGGATGGFADFFDGLEEAAQASTAEERITGITKAVNGLNEAVSAIASGDVMSTVRNLGAGIAEIVGNAAKVPGLGGLFGAVFDLGTTIVQSISDAFTGDSPAARAIRDSLTPAVTSAFTQGILNGIRGAEGWQDDLRDNVKLIFLQSLIEAFINGAIIQTFLAPIVAEYSKLIAKGQVEAATAYLQTALPPALDQAVNAAEGFVGSLPPGLLPSQGSNTSTGSREQQPSTFQLPHAIPAVSSSGAAEFGRYVTSFGSHVTTFGTTIQQLQAQGITVRVEQTRSGGAAAARAV